MFLGFFYLINLFAEFREISVHMNSLTFYLFKYISFLQFLQLVSKTFPYALKSNFLFIFPIL